MTGSVGQVLASMARSSTDFYTPSLADLHLVPILDYFARTEDGRAALARHPRLSAWWTRIEQRPSVARTRPSLG